MCNPGERGCQWFAHSRHHSALMPLNDIYTSLLPPMVCPTPAVLTFFPTQDLGCLRALSLTLVGLDTVLQVARFISFFLSDKIFQEAVSIIQQVYYHSQLHVISDHKEMIMTTDCLFARSQAQDPTFSFHHPISSST